MHVTLVDWAAYCAKGLLGAALLGGNFYFWAWLWRLGPGAHTASHFPMRK